jgi:hypothetical protein
VTNVWRVADDDGTKVEYLGTLGYWRITTNDGTQLYFGMQRLPGWTTGARETASQLWEEMFANHSGEPCFHPSGYTYSHCTKTYRWMLDYVVDPHGNSMSYWYSNTNAGNLAGSNNSGQSVNWYVRDAWLERIEYGTRAGNETNATPPAKIEFTNSDRCLSNCGTETSPITANWPDVPFRPALRGGPLQQQPDAVVLDHQAPDQNHDQGVDGYRHDVQAGGRLDLRPILSRWHRRADPVAGFHHPHGV